MTVGVRSHLVTLSAPAASITSGTPVSLLTCATAGPSWPHSGPTMKCTFSCSTTRRAWVSAWSGLQVVSPVTISTLRPPAVYFACSQNSVNPSCMSLPGEASGPVSGGSRPMRIGPVCACASGAAPRAASAAMETSERNSTVYHGRSSFVGVRAPGGGAAIRCCLDMRAHYSYRARRAVNRGARDATRQHPIPIPRETTMADETLRFGTGRDALRSEDEPLLSGRGASPTTSRRRARRTPRSCARRSVTA